MNKNKTSLLVAALSALLISACGGGGDGRVANATPVADAGPDQAVTTGNLVTLDGSGSSDAEGDTLSFAWTLTTPAGSAAALSGASSNAPSFTPDVGGAYVASLIVNDGNSNSAPDTVTITATVPIAVGGGAIKGVVRNGLVTAFLGATAIGSGTTNAAGRYAIDVDPSAVGETVVVEVRGRPASDSVRTTMVCDVPTAAGGCSGAAFGSEVLVDESFVMSTVIPELGSTSVNAPVTPVTHAARQRAQALAGTGAVTAAQARQALGELANIFAGIDPETVEAIDLTDADAVANATPEELAYTAFVSGLLRRSPADAAAAAGNLAAELADGQLSADALDQLADDARTQLSEAAGRNDATGSFTSMNNRAANARAGDGTVTAEADPDRGSPAVARAKAAIANLRNLGNSIDQLGTPGAAFAAEIQAVEAALDDFDLDLQLAPIGQLLNAAEAFYSESDGTSGSQTVDGVVITLTAGGDNADDSVTIVGTHTNGAVFDLAASFPGDVEADTRQTLAVLTDGTFDGAAQSAGEPEISLEIIAGDLTVTKQAAEAIGSGEVEADDFDSAVLDFSGGLTITLTDGSGQALSAVGEITLALLNCTNCARETEQTQAPTKVVIDEEPQDEPLPPVNVTEFSFSGALAGADTADAVDFSFSLTQTETSARNYDANMDLSASNVPDAALAISSSAILGDLDAALTLSLAVVGFDEVNQDLTLSANLLLELNGSTLRIVAVNDADDGTVDEVTITNTAGVVINITGLSDTSGDGPVGTISVDDDENVATIEETDNGLLLIRYADGTFESLG